MAVVSLPGIITAPIMGVTADRMGRRTAITLCLLLAGVGGLCAGFSSQMSTLLIFRLVQGIGSAGLVYLPMVLIGDHWEGSQRSRYIGWNAATLTAAIALTPFLSGLIAGIWSWRSSFVLFGSALIMVYPAMRWLPNRRIADSGLREQWIGAMPVLKSPHVLTVMALAVLLFMIVFGVKYTTLPVSLSIDYGLPPFTRGLLLSIPSITSTFGGLMMGRIHNRIGKIPTLVVGFACYGIATILFSTAPSLTVLVMAAVIFGVATEPRFLPWTKPWLAPGRPTLEARSSACTEGRSESGKHWAPLVRVVPSLRLALLPHSCWVA